MVVLLGLPIGIAFVRLRTVPFLPGRTHEPCTKVEPSRADFDGDGRVDKMDDIFVSNDRQFLRVTTQRGVVTDVPGGEFGAQFEVVDLDDDGTHELLGFTGTSVSARHSVFVTPDSAGRLTRSLDVEEGYVAAEERVRWACADINSDGREEVIRGLAYRGGKEAGRWVSEVFVRDGDGFRLECVNRGVVRHARFWDPRIDRQLVEALSTPCVRAEPMDERVRLRRLESNSWFLQMYREIGDGPIGGTRDQAWALGSWWSILDHCERKGMDCDERAVTVVSSRVGVDPRRVDRCSNEARSFSRHGGTFGEPRTRFDDILFKGYLWTTRMLAPGAFDEPSREEILDGHAIPRRCPAGETREEA